MRTSFLVASVMTILFLAAPNKVEAQKRKSAIDADACTFCGVWEYVDNFSGLDLKYYLKISQAGVGKFKLVIGQYQEGEIYWAEPYIRKANGIYLTMVNGRLVGRFVSSNFYATHGTEFTYKITCTIQSNNKLGYSVWSSINGETEKFVARRVSQ